MHLASSGKIFSLVINSSTFSLSYIAADNETTLRQGNGTGAWLQPAAAAAAAS